MKRPLLWSTAVLLVALLVFLLDDGEEERETPALRGPDSERTETTDPPTELAAPDRPAREEGAREALAVPDSPAGVVERPSEDDFELLELEEEIELPPDPVERGDCALLLELIDGETGHYVQSTVDLWRLGAPGNEDWTEGDQLQTTVHVHEGGTTVGQLPEGTYRARVTAELQDADDPPEFAVHGSLTRVTLQVELPRSFPAYLRVFDENGIEVVEAEYSAATGDFYHYHQDEIPWRRERRLKKEPAGFLVDSEISSMLESPFGSTPVQAGPRGFHLGDFRQASRQDLPRQRITLTGPRGCRVRLDVDGRAGEPQFFVGVMVNPALVLESLFLPDGSRDPSLTTRLELLCEALPVGESKPLDAWRELPILVTVGETDAYQELKFTFRALDLPLNDRFLTPR